MNGQEKITPVKIGEVYEVSINALGGKGDGIAKVKGFVLFVPGVQKGDYIKIRITRVLPSVGFAEVIEKLERPPHQPRFATVTKEEMQEEEAQPEQHYEDTEDFGEENK